MSACTYLHAKCRHAARAPAAPLSCNVSAVATRERKRKELATRTAKSRFPTGTNPNFCERILLPISVPLNPLFASSVSVTLHDNRLGGLSVPKVATTAVSLDAKIPWSTSFRPPRGAIKRDSLNPFEAKNMLAALADGVAGDPVAIPKVSEFGPHRRPRGIAGGTAVPYSP
ncbi:hypothetical protein EON66_10550, partial [archaeon]